MTSTSSGSSDVPVQRIRSRVTFGDRRDSIDAAIAFLGDVKAIATDEARGLAGGLSTAVICAIPGFTPQSAILRWHLGARGGEDRGHEDGEGEDGKLGHRHLRSFS